MSILKRTQRQPTDLMHRRVSLRMSGEFLCHGVAMRIQTNSHAILRAAAASELTPIEGTLARSCFCWKLTVEDDPDAFGPKNAAQVWCIDRSVFIEIAERQWFALDAETGDGVGFLATHAPELAANEYLETVLKYVLPRLEKRTRPVNCHD